MKYHFNPVRLLSNFNSHFETLRRILFFCCPIALLALTIAGCKQTEKKTDQSSTSGDSDRLFSAQPATESGIELKGFYRSANNVKIFFRCDHPASRFWVNDETGKMDSMYEKAIASGNFFPEDYIMADVSAQADVASADIKSRGFDSILNVHKVENAGVITNENSCSPFEFWAGGQNPGWSIEISRSENIIRLRVPGSQAALLFPYLAPQIGRDSVFTYRSENVATGQSLLAVFKNETCESSALSFSAHIIYSGLKLNGCALKGSSF